MKAWWIWDYDVVMIFKAMPWNIRKIQLSAFDGTGCDSFDKAALED